MSGACSNPPFSLAASTAIAPAAPVAQRLVPSSGSTAMSTSGNSAFGACVAKPTFSPMYSIGASSRSPSPMTMVPSISTASMVLRIASTATSSALCRSPNPIVRAAAIAPFSTTRRNSRLSCSSMLPSETLWVKIAAPMCRSCGLSHWRYLMLLSGAWTAGYARPNARARRYGLLYVTASAQSLCWGMICPMKSCRWLLVLCALLSLVAPRSPNKERNADWPVWGGGPENTHYSKLAQINRSNVKKLAIAWTFDTGEQGGLQTSPIVVDNVLYGITPTQKIFALNAATGKLLWKFDSGIKGTQPDRGLAYWSNGKDKRIVAGVMNFLYALDAASGKPIASFGQDGRIDLRQELGREPGKQSIALTSPGVVYKDLVIVGGRNPETLPAPPGDVRAYDVRTGKLRWSFHTIPRPGEFGYDT